MDRASPGRPAPGLSRYGYAVPAARVGSAASDGTTVGHEGTCRVLVTIPVRNEVQRLEGTIEELDAAFRATPFDVVLSIAEDGSTDGTKEMLQELPLRWPNLVVQEAADSLGRGRALRELWAETPADIYCFTDADLACGPSTLVRAVDEVARGNPIVVGSRYAPGATTTRPPVRCIVSKGYNQLLRFSFGESIRDHQCGLKAFSAAAIRELLPETKEDSWFWDTEILIVALARGYPVRELPVDWVERKSSRTHYQRLLSDVILHGAGMLRLKTRIPRLPQAARRSGFLPPEGAGPLPRRPGEPRPAFGLGVGPAPEFALSRAAEELKQRRRAARSAGAGDLTVVGDPDLLGSGMRR